MLILKRIILTGPTGGKPDANAGDSHWKSRGKLVAGASLITGVHLVTWYSQPVCGDV